MGLFGSKKTTQNSTNSSSGAQTQAGHAVSINGGGSVSLTTIESDYGAISEGVKLANAAITKVVDASTNAFIHSDKINSSNDKKFSQLLEASKVANSQNSGLTSNIIDNIFDLVSSQNLASDARVSEAFDFINRENLPDKGAGDKALYLAGGIALVLGVVVLRFK